MIHLAGLPHTSLSESLFSTCAFTTKAVRWTKVLALTDYEITLYWSGGFNEVDSEVVEIFSEQERLDYFGDDVSQNLPAIAWDPKVDYWSKFNSRCIEEIRKRIQPGDFVAIWAGNVQQEIVDAFKDEYTVIEPAVGYEGLAQGTWACFESYAWMHNRWGAYGEGNGRAFDAVVPNFLNPDDFEIGTPQGYGLYLGRIIPRKGTHVAGYVSRVTGIPMYIAGAGVEARTETGIVMAGKVPVEPCTYIGVLGIEERKKVLSEANFLIVPTLYIEPFGTVHAEALMSGVPVLTTDWGVFTETVREGIDGYRFRTLQEAVDGANLLKSGTALDKEKIREGALQRFSYEAVAPKFARWLDNLKTLRGDSGWYALRPEFNVHFTLPSN